MTHVAVIGAQWGDEGKGKIVDWLSERADVIVRFQGGHNAGHTLVINGETYKLSLLPSGVVRGGKLSVIGNGVVIDPWALFEEIDRLSAQGVRVTAADLLIAENAPLILPVHRELDAARETSNSGIKLGTTKRGIGPAYEDKVGRRAIRVIDLADLASLPVKIANLLTHHNALRRGLGLAEYDGDELLRMLTEVAPRLLPFAGPVWRRLGESRQRGEWVLFEGAQGVLLDIDHGTYPFVTSSNTVGGQAAAGSGIGPGAISYVVGLCKAYTTRVGEGPFPTELFDDVGSRIGERGREFGCGWFDAVLVKKAVMTGGVNGLALTKLDILDGFEELKIAVGYELDGKTIDYLPAGTAMQARVRPVYETLEGWTGTTQGARRWADLPAAAVKYVRRIEELVGAPVAILSTSPERDDTILVRDPFLGR